MIEYHGLDNKEQVFFYEQDFYVLSNFSAFTIKGFGRTFFTAEHFYHWRKFALGFKCATQESVEAAKVANLIEYAASAHEAFKIAQANKHKRRPDWDKVKVIEMKAVLQLKVDQHEYVRKKLLATGNRELIENSWRDDFWGWGPNKDGQNQLGKLWMEIRSELLNGEDLHTVGNV